MGRVKTRKYRLVYSETSKNLIRKLHPQLKPIIKTKIEQIKEYPYLGKYLENELSGYLSLRAKRYRIIYKIDDTEKVIQIHYAGHRKDVYELLGEELKKKGK
jgi:mRNA-degrading endonuclease RelE of RelBE toxin-antitoxin system